MRYGEIRGNLEAFDAEPPPPSPTGGPRRIELEPRKVEQGLAQLVLSVVELLRQLMEKQALRSIDSGRLDEQQIERLGTTLMHLETRMDELKTHFGIDDLNMDLGPLGPLLDE
ncbi:MAG: gas vesicle protein K [Myxococcota bacterium]